MSIPIERNEVSIAFEIVLEELEGVVASLNLDGASAFQRGDYEVARSLVENATRLSDFRTRVHGLQREWENLFSPAVPSVTTFAGRPTKGERRTRLRRGLRTPEDAFRRPILEALVELGGSGPMSDVLDKVGNKMRDVLNDYDLRTMGSQPSTIRWRNSAQWCRNTMVHQDGLMRSESPYGVWEISDKGRAYLQELQHQGR